MRIDSSILPLIKQEESRLSWPCASGEHRKNCFDFDQLQISLYPYQTEGVERRWRVVSSCWAMTWGWEKPCRPLHGRRRF